MNKQRHTPTAVVLAIAAVLAMPIPSFAQVKVIISGGFSVAYRPRATMATDSVPRLRILTATSAEMPSRERTSVIMPVLLPGTAIAFARSNVCRIVIPFIGSDSGGGFSLVEHAMSSRALGAPLHRHAREDEYSYVSEGRVGALLGDHVREAGPGSLIFKPRNQWHTFWNAGDEPARILEIISPAGFEHYFVELTALGGSRAASPEALRSLGQRYSLDVDPRSIPDLLERFQLRIGEPI